MTGIPELLVLRLLDGKEMYGYELVKTIRLTTDDAITLGEGVVYPALHSLEAAGALRSRQKTVSGRPRVYYTLTAKGRRRLGKLMQEWDRVSDGVAAALGTARA